MWYSHIYHFGIYTDAFLLLFFHDLIISSPSHIGHFTVSKIIAFFSLSLYSFTLIFYHFFFFETTDLEHDRFFYSMAGLTVEEAIELEQRLENML